MKAVIMAGGFGTRLRPLTSNIPKPMVPLVNSPMMEHIVHLLKRHGVKEIVATLFYHPDVISSYFGDGSGLNVSMQYRKAEADLGTAGSVRNGRDFLDERFFVISGDVLTDFDLTAAVRFHEEKKAKATLLLTRHESPLQFGVVLTDGYGKITRFLEKPTWGEVFSDTINTGIYILEPEVLDLVPRNEEFDFSKNLFPMLMERGMGLYGYIASGYWRDIGNLNEYQDAHIDALMGKVNIQFEGKKQGTMYVGEGSLVETSPDNITGMVVIGKNCKIHKDVVLATCTIGDNCEVLPGTVIRKSILWNNVKVGSRAELSLDVVCNNCVIGDGTVVNENVFISDTVNIGRKCVIHSNIKIWPEKAVEDGAVLSRSLVWEDRWLRELFTNSRVSGISNVEINPEFAAKLGAAYGALLGAGSTVVTSRDADNVSRMINRSLIVGLMSAGVHCHDLRASSIPIMRHELRIGKERGGIHVRKSPYNKNYTDVIFFDAGGKDLPSNKIKAVERLFFGEDAPRASHEKVGSISFPERSTEAYIERFIGTLDIERVKSAGLKLVIDYSNGVASTIFPNILGSLNVQVVSLNAYLDKTKLTRTRDEIEKSMRELGFMVTSLKYDVGCLMDASAEQLSVVDENGNIITADRMLSLFVKLVGLTMKDVKTIAVPVSASGEIDIIAQTLGLKVVRTRDSHLAMMDAASNKEVKFVGGTRGGYIFNDFLFAVDAMFATAKLLELMARSGKRIGELDGETPRLYAVKRSVACPWNAKGKVMRRIMEDTEKMPRDLIEGVKVYPQKINNHTSVFFNPDRTRALFYVQAESADATVAHRLAEDYEKKILDWIKLP